MSSRPIANKEVQLALQERMALSRAALLAANRSVALPKPGRRGHEAAINAVTSVVEAPHVIVLTAVVAGVIVLGPRRMMAMAGRSGLTAWLARNLGRWLTQ